MNNQWRGCATEGTERVTHGNIEIFAGFADGRGFSDHPAPGFLRTGPRFPGCLPGKSRSGLWKSGFAPSDATRAQARTGGRLEQERIMLKLHLDRKNVESGKGVSERREIGSRGINKK